MRKNILIIVLIILIIVVVLALIFKPNVQSVTQAEEFNLDNEYKYIITTSASKFSMQNDGGSHTNIYYLVDLNINKVTKCEDKYIGFEGYEYKGKVLYSKELSETENQKLKLILDNIDKENKKEEVIFDFYKISAYNKEDVTVYNKDIINQIKEILEKG